MGANRLAWQLEHPPRPADRRLLEPAVYAVPGVARTFMLDENANTGAVTGALTCEGGSAQYRVVLRNTATGDMTSINHGESQTFNDDRERGWSERRPDERPRLHSAPLDRSRGR